jgi:hypothetical protein
VQTYLNFWRLILIVVSCILKNKTIDISKEFFEPVDVLFAMLPQPAPLSNVEFVVGNAAALRGRPIDSV